ncbi:hypothetical protein DRQ09_08880 [candidate division KSB1 bacterium]|nr:MAG: hypothetical protein DRQ09_08880 [candidate division KSB1 bacterium]
MRKLFPIDHSFYGYDITRTVGQASLPDLLYIIATIGAFIIIRNACNNELMKQGIKISKKYKKDCHAPYGARNDS